MKKSPAVTELIDELKSEHVQSDVETCSSSAVLIYVDADSLENDDPIRFNANDCRLLLASTSTVDRLVEALNSEDASIVLQDIDLPSEIIDALERNFLAVDFE